MNWSDGQYNSAPQVFTYSSDLEVVPNTVASKVDRRASDQESLPILYPPKPDIRPPLFTKVRCGIFLGSLLTTLVLGGVLGGALGSRLASCKTDLSMQDVMASRTNISNPSTTTTISSTTSNMSWPPFNTSSRPPWVPIAQCSPTSVVKRSSLQRPILLEDYQPPSPSTVDLLHNDCVSVIDRLNTWGDRYVTNCGRDSKTGSDAVEGGVIADILVLTAYSFTECLDACSSFNHRAGLSGWSLKCRSIAFHMDMKNATAASRGNCWLKNGTLYDPTSATLNERVHIAQLAV